MTGNMPTTNHWYEPYPTSLPALIKKSERSLKSLLHKLNSPECKVLVDFYATERGKVQRRMEEFLKLGYMPNVKTRKQARANNEIKGLYLFGQVVSGKVIPVYIGISRTIMARLKNHGWGKLHNQATLAYAMAASRNEHEGERKHLPYNKILKEQLAIRNYKVAILPEMSDYDLYFMEVHIAGKLKLEWNSFRTH